MWNGGLVQAGNDAADTKKKLKCESWYIVEIIFCSEINRCLATAYFYKNW